MITDYEAHIASLISLHLGPRASDVPITPLTDAMGIRSVFFGARGWEFSDPEVLRDVDFSAHEPLLCRTIILALHSHRQYSPQHFQNGVAIMEGLLQNNRWRQCLNDSQSSYALAAQILQIAAAVHLSVTMSVRSDLQPSMCSALNEWLSPATPFVELPSKEVLMRTMFGDAWYDLMEGSDLGAGWRPVELITLLQPAFLPGLVTFSQTANESDLPSLECAP